MEVALLPWALWRFALGFYASIGIYALYLLTVRSRARMIGAGLLLVAAGGAGGMTGRDAGLSFVALIAGLLLAAAGAALGWAGRSSRPWLIAAWMLGLVLMAVFLPWHP